MDLIGQLAVVGLVLAALAMALWVLQRRGMVRLNGFGTRTRQPRELQLVERLQLTPQHAVCLVRFREKTLLIGTAPSTCTLLSEDEDL